MSQAERTEQRRRQSWYGLKRPIKRAVALPVVNQVAHALTLSRRGAAAAARLPAPLTVTQVEGRVDGVTFTMNDPAQCILAKELYWGAGERPSPQDQFALEVFAKLARQASHVLDIGSYTGIFSLVAAKANPQIGVDAFEIVPSNYLAALGNVISNDLVGRVEVHLEGVGEPGSIRMPTATAGSALPDFWSIDDATEGAGGVSVPITTLADVFRRLGQRGIDPDRVLIKVDVEGHENALVASSAQAIAELRPTFLMEILPGSDTTPLAEAFGAPGAAGAAAYCSYLITEDRLREAATLRGEDDYRDWLITTSTPDELRSQGIEVEELVQPHPAATFDDGGDSKK